jgi:hypothetical protein
MEMLRSKKRECEHWGQHFDVVDWLRVEKD